jgi:Cu(I)/Ag(I) efflux system protein CusF
MMKKTLWVAALAVSFSLPLQASESAPLSQGEVRKVDAASIGMPPMTMVFEVQPASLLDGVEVGDRVHFQARQEGNRYIVTELQVRE